jgi:hypothetical protein
MDIKIKIIGRENKKLVEIKNVNGNSKIISKSNTRKIILNKKKCSENGIRAELKLSNPHSNLDIMVRVWFSLFLIIPLITSSNKGSNKKIDIRINFIIICIEVLPIFNYIKIIRLFRHNTKL